MARFKNPCVEVLLCELTLPFSNLLTVLMQFWRMRSPVSPWSPMRQTKTLASVPLPLTVPVHTVTRYLITGDTQISETTPAMPSIAV